MNNASQKVWVNLGQDVRGTSKSPKGFTQPMVPTRPSSNMKLPEIFTLLAFFRVGAIGLETHYQTHTHTHKYAHTHTHVLENYCISACHSMVSSINQAIWLFPQKTSTASPLYLQSQICKVSPLWIGNIVFLFIWICTEMYKLFSHCHFLSNIAELFL